MCMNHGGEMTAGRTSKSLLHAPFPLFASDWAVKKGAENAVHVCLVSWSSGRACMTERRGDEGN